LDEDGGTYQGVTLGKPVSAALRGVPSAKPGADWTPRIQGKDPRSFPLAAYRSWRYYRGDETGFAAADGGTVGILAAGRGTYTTAGNVAIGDRLGRVKQAYVGARCATASFAESDKTFRYCVGRLRPGRYLWFGGDPIDTIAIAAAPLGDIPGQMSGPLLRVR
jgi:hypothetical protein